MRGATSTIAPEPFITTAVRDGGHAVVMDRNPLAPVVLQGALIAAAILSKYSKVPVAAIEAATFRGEFALRMDPATIQPLIDGALKYGLIAKEFRAAEIIAD